MLNNVVKKNTDENQLRTVIPNVNIDEKENEIYVEAEMPGLLQQDIAVEVHGDELTIQARKVNNVPKGYSVVCQERIPVEYKRVFTLGKEINREAIQARYENGILYIVLSKSESARPRKIEIS